MAVRPRGICLILGVCLLITCALAATNSTVVASTPIKKVGPPYPLSRNLEPYVVRPDFCASLTYPSKLPNATVVITVLNEEMKMIETNIEAILAKTPAAYLDSIIVVDDFSETLPVSSSILRYPKVQLIRTGAPMGVAGARMAGAAHGKGEVLIFFDAQMEVTERWIEPLLSYVKNHPKSVAAAIIDGIDEDTGKYISRGNIPLVTLMHKTLAFKWTTDVPAPIGYVLYSPSLLGSAFAIQREWFDEGGKYDPGNRVWGIENVELATRVWACGGEVVFMPCSHLGHYYRSKRKIPSPRFNGDYYWVNAVRFAEVWMDETAADFWPAVPKTAEWLAQTRNSPDLAERKQLRQKLKCKSFSWYLDNVVKRIETLYNVKVAQPDY